MLHYTYINALLLEFPYVWLVFRIISMASMIFRLSENLKYILFCRFSSHIYTIEIFPVSHMIGFAKSIAYTHIFHGLWFPEYYNMFYPDIVCFLYRKTFVVKMPGKYFETPLELILRGFPKISVLFVLSWRNYKQMSLENFGCQKISPLSTNRRVEKKRQNF